MQTYAVAPLNHLNLHAQAILVCNAWPIPRKAVEQWFGIEVELSDHEN
jgi:hypothetical protein